MQVIAKAKGLPWKDLRRLGDVQHHLEVSLSEMVKIVADTLHPEPYSKEEVCKVLGVTEEELVTTSLSQNTLEGESVMCVCVCVLSLIHI